jgi:cytochrome c oxidase cbb3-type subunit 4
MTYDALRQFADSWGLVALVAVFVAVAAFAFRPGARAHYDRASRIPLDDGSED